MSHSQDQRGKGAVLGEAVFLAVSWTWCIGMFLPVLLVRDFGLMGWVVFALPNCLGAALMGAVLMKPGAVDRVLRDHGPAVRLFSLATTAFQWFFAAWLLQTLGFGVWGLAALAVFIAVLMLTPGDDRRGSRLRTTSLIVFAASIVLGAAWWFKGGDRVPLAELPAPLLPKGDLGPLAAVCALGFFLCPYLDVTFLRSARRAGAGGRTVAFLLGFLVLFPLMILLTLLYAPTFIKDSVENSVNLRMFPVPWLIAFHMVVQLGFTIAAHERGAQDEFSGKPFDSDGWRFVAFLAGVILAVVGPRFVPIRGVMGGNETIYRCFLSFYGLVFPAYVWVCAWPIGEAGRPRAGRLTLLGLAVAAATPFYWWGFLDHKTPMLWYGVGIVIVAGLIAKFLPNPPARSGPDGAGVPAPLDPGPDVLVVHAAPGRADDPAGP